jgi:hypothetical protein
MRHELPLPLPVLAAEADDMTGPSGDACRAGAAPGGEKKKRKAERTKGPWSPPAGPADGSESDLRGTQRHTYNT